MIGLANDLASSQQRRGEFIQKVQDMLLDSDEENSIDISKMNTEQFNEEDTDLIDYVRKFKAKVHLCLKGLD